MTDKDILEIVYKMANGGKSSLRDVRSFIQEEWQKRDECGLSKSDQALYLEEAEAERMRNKVAEELYNDLPRVD